MSFIVKIILEGTVGSNLNRSRGSVRDKSRRNKDI